MRKLNNFVFVILSFIFIGAITSSDGVKYSTATSIISLQSDFDLYSPGITLNVSEFIVNSGAYTKLKFDSEAGSNNSTCDETCNTFIEHITTQETNEVIIEGKRLNEDCFSVYENLLNEYKLAEFSYGERNNPHNENNPPPADYSLYISKSENLITNTKRPLIAHKAHDFKSNTVDIELIQQDVKFNFTDLPLDSLDSLDYKINLLEFVVLENFIIGIEQNTHNIKVYKIIIDKIVEIFFKNNDFSELLSNSDIKFTRILSADNYLYLVDDKNNVYIYTKGDKEKTVLKLYFTLNIPNTLNYQVIKIVNKQNIFFTGLKGAGVLITNIETNRTYYLDRTTSNSNSSELILKLKDMEMKDNSNSSSIYLLIENFGIKILDISDLDQINFSSFEFYHPYIKSLHAYNKAEEKFLGCIIDTLDNKVSEFYFEFNNQDELNPILHRVFLWSKKLELNFMYSDDDFTYLNDNNSNSLILINQANVYRFNIDSIRNREVLNKKGFTFKTESTQIGFITKDYLTYSNLAVLSDAKLVFNFMREGNFKFQIATEKMDNNYLNLIFHVYNLKSSKVRIIMKSYKFAVWVYFFFIIALVLVYKKYYKYNEVVDLKAAYRRENESDFSSEGSRNSQMRNQNQVLQVIN